MTPKGSSQKGQIKLIKLCQNDKEKKREYSNSKIRNKEGTSLSMYKNQKDYKDYNFMATSEVIWMKCIQFLEDTSYQNWLKINRKSG